jgi:hypothetical protein
MAIRTETRTIHTVYVDVPDDALARVESGDEVEIVLVGRFGPTSRKRLTYRDVVRLTEGNLR